ncbi:MAG TPA: A/G-specific adenine glycosylase [Chryseolinea sp.]|nr:A/G-specific adenine glycosylase [Chryseolinea sp.]
MDKRYFSDKLVKWYEQNKRDLPWRATTDPYKIWLSEIILQQTRVNQGLPYYLKFVDKYPNVSALASASQQEVLRLWQGLGYYSRARNLHECAQQVVDKHGSCFPANYQALKQLKGVGDYTAAAIASIAYGESVAVVDGNVFRVLSRVFGIEAPIDTSAGKKKFTELANEVIDPNKPDLHNQALMEFGALHCTPKNPRCEECIFESGCFAAQREMQDLLPVKLRSTAVRVRYFYYFVVKKGNSYLMKKRTEKDIWQGLFDFFMLEEPKPTKIEKLIERFNAINCLQFQTGDFVISDNYKHILSHQIIHAKFIFLKAVSNNFLKEPFAFYTAKKIEELPKPVLISRFLSDFQLLS